MNLYKSLTSRITAFMILILSILLTAVPVSASAGNYGLKPLYGTNQIDKNGQIDVYGNPGSTVNISIGIVNKDSKPHKYTATINTAYTTDGGNYAFDNNMAKDSTLDIKLRNYVSPKQQTVTAAPSQVTNVTFQLTIPEEKFNGYIMGGITVKPAKGEKEYTGVTSDGTLLKNRFKQGIPVKVRQNKLNTMQPKFRAISVVPYANKTLKQRGVQARIQNYVKGFNGDINATATVTKRPNDHKFKKIAKINDMSPAPNSNFNYPIDWGSTALQAGNYHLHVKMTSNDKTKSWIVDKDFSISDADAAKYNKLSGIKPNYMWLWILIAILALLLVLGLGIYFGRRNQNKQQPMNNNMNNQR